MTTKEIKVGYLARVEGEGSLYLKFEGNEVKDVQLKIFEPPRFFEGFLCGRAFTEVTDITARICGICPVAYQMSSAHAMEDACGLTVSEPIAQMRRLLYCAEWIESHVLHIYMLHAPDFLRYHDAVKMAKDHKKKVQDGLQLKKIGNELLSIIGGREIHPINVRIGGFYKWPDTDRLAKIEPSLRWARDQAIATAQWAATFEFPEFNIDYEYVSLCHKHEYPMNRGRLKSSSGLDISTKEYENHFVEEHVAHSNALHAKRIGGGSYLTGPLARFSLNYNQLTQTCKEVANDIKLEPTVTNPFKSILVRAIEVIYACEEALRIIMEYKTCPVQDPSFEVAKPVAANGYAITEAPRGCLYHRYEIDACGEIKFAKIVPPTSQNQKRIEDDLREIVPSLVNLSDEAMTARCEQVVRNYDPCISCATHFLKLEVDRS